MIIDALIEGIVDEAVAARLIGFCGHQFGTAYGRRGWTYLRDRAAGFNERARYGNPILMLVDFLDTGLECPPLLPKEWLPNRCGNMVLRAVVRETESWLLADRRNLARFLGVSEALIDRRPEALPDPKQALIILARRSRKVRLRDAIVPQPNLSSPVGPAYNAALVDFVLRHWSIEGAAGAAPSLSRCVKRLRELHDDD